MPIFYATRNMLQPLTNDNEIILDQVIWYDNINCINEDDMIEVNTVDYLTLLAKENDIISVIISEIKELDISILSSINSIEHIRLEAIESITFSDFNNNLKFLEINYCALNYPPVIPENLVSLDLSMNLIDSLEHMEIPPSLKKLNLNDNHFKNFPNLVDTLEEVYLCNNYLGEVGTIPSNLKKLFIGNNYITKYPTLPNNIVTDISNNPINTVSIEV